MGLLDVNHTEMPKGCQAGQVAKEHSYNAESGFAVGDLKLGMFVKYDGTNGYSESAVGENVDGVIINPLGQYIEVDGTALFTTGESVAVMTHGQVWLEIATASAVIGRGDQVDVDAADRAQVTLTAGGNYVALEAEQTDCAGNRVVRCVFKQTTGEVATNED